MREARRTLALLPGFPIAHWLCTTVHVARQAWEEAERELARLDKVFTIHADLATALAVTKS